MYRSLQQEFSSDKAAKIKSDQLELPKGSQAEAKKQFIIPTSAFMCQKIILYMV